MHLQLARHNPCAQRRRPRLFLRLATAHSKRSGCLQHCRLHVIEHTLRLTFGMELVRLLIRYGSGILGLIFGMVLLRLVTSNASGLGTALPPSL
jgi:hypothetical protein